MAEKNEMRKENIQKVKDVLSGGKLASLLSEAKGLDAEVRKIKQSLELKAKTILEDKKAKELAQAEAVVEAMVEKAPAKEVVQPKPVETVVKPEEVKPVEKVKETKSEEVKAQPEQKVESKAEVVQPARTEFVAKERPSFIVRREGPIKPEQPKAKQEFRPQREFKPNQDRQDRTKGATGFNKAPKTDRPAGPKKQQPSTYVAPAVVPTVNNDKRNFTKKKSANDRFEEKHVINKRALVRNQVDIDDFDENKTGYRKFRPVKKQKTANETNVIKIEK